VNHTAQGFDVNKKPVTVKHSGLAQIWAGAAAAKFFGVPVTNGHYPDVFGKVQAGIVYAKPTKLAEHGGMNAGDRHVVMIVDAPGIAARVVSAPVETTQVAPTILSDPARPPGVPLRRAGSHGALVSAWVSARMVPAIWAR
jgi:hypothetical protein